MRKEQAMSENGKPCVDSPEARQFDFWVGEWDLTWGEDQQGSNSITKLWEGCAIQEQFDGAPAMDFQGMSVSTYDAALGQWRQTWVDSEGTYLDLVGEFENGEMVLFNRRTINGIENVFKMRFFNIGLDSLDWTWERSEDQGKTWDLRWQIHYQRKGT